MLLRDYLDRYNQTHDIQPSTLAHYRWVIRSFERHNGALRTSDLSGAAVSAWLAWLADCGRSPWTIKQRRISLLVLWRAAWQDGLAPPLEPVRRLRPVRHSPQAWTLPEVRQLIRTSEQIPVRARWWSALIRAGYDVRPPRRRNGYSQAAAQLSWATPAAAQPRLGTSIAASSPCPRCRRCDYFEIFPDL